MVRTLLAVILCLGCSSAAQASLWLYQFSRPIESATGVYQVGDTVTLQFTREEFSRAFLDIMAANPQLILGDGALNTRLDDGFNQVSFFYNVIFDRAGSEPFTPVSYFPLSTSFPLPTADEVWAINESLWSYTNKITGDSWTTTAPATLTISPAVTNVPEASASATWLGLFASVATGFMVDKKNRPDASCT